MIVQNILDRKGAEVFTIEPTATVRTAAQLMQAHGIAALVVKSADVIGGLISEREIVHAISQHGERALSMAVLDVMTRSAKWSRLMRYAAVYKSDSETLGQFIRRKGGINKCAARFSQRLGRI